MFLRCNEFDDNGLQHLTVFMQKKKCHVHTTHINMHKPIRAKVMVTHRGKVKANYSPLLHNVNAPSQPTLQCQLRDH